MKIKAPDVLLGKPDDKIIIGNFPIRYVLSHSGDGHIAISLANDGEGGWFDADEFAAHIGKFVSDRL